MRFCQHARRGTTAEAAPQAAVPRHGLVNHAPLLAGDLEEEGAPSPLEAALPNKAAYQHIRALPCDAGSAVIFTHRIIHWGSAATKRAPCPRIAISFVFADPTFEVRKCGRARVPCLTALVVLSLIAPCAKPRELGHAHTQMLLAPHA